MGMNVYGKKPDSKAGEYFRNNVWWWRPLWNYCLQVAPAVAGQVQRGHSNDGDGLGAGGSKKLSEILLKELGAGRTQEYAVEYQKRLDAMPDEACEICSGTGKRKKPPQVGAGNMECNGCQGKGQRRPFDTNYSFSTDNVREFAAFLASSGGFEIY